MRRIGKNRRHPGQRLVSPEDATIRRPIGQQTIQGLQLGHFGHETGTALLGRLDGMGARLVGAQPLGIGKAGLHRHEAPHPQFDRLFHQKIRAGLFQRREDQPKVGGHDLRGDLFLGPQDAGAFSSRLDPGAPDAVAAIEHRQRGAHGQAHHRKQIVGLPV